MEHSATSTATEDKGTQGAAGDRACALKASEYTARDAALQYPGTHSNPYFAYKARAFVGSAAIAVAVTIPDVSFGAIGTAVLRIDMGAPVAPLPDTIWSPAAQSQGPVHVQIIAAEQIAPSAVTYRSQSNYGAFDRSRPLEVLEAGSLHFEIAFAELELPQPRPVEMSARRRTMGDAPAAQPSANRDAPAPLAALVEAPQVGNASAANSPGLSASRDERRIASLASNQLTPNDSSIEAAFAGVINVSGAAREAIPVASPERTDEAVRMAIPLPVSEPGLNPSAAVESALIEKRTLDARINGVLTGSVDFQQLDGTIAIRLGSVVDMLRSRFSASELAHMRAGRSIDAFVTLEQMQSAGIPIRYNPAYDEIEFGIDYDDAPNASKVQVEQISILPSASEGRGESTAIDQIIPR